LGAGDGEEALKSSRSYPGHIDLVFIDLVMPRMGGLEAARHIAAQRPKTKIAVMSAGTKGRELAATAELPFLQKPFTLSALREHIQALLGPTTRFDDR